MIVHIILLFLNIAVQSCNSILRFDNKKISFLSAYAR